jgi:hypothetical protein
LPLPNTVKCRNHFSKIILRRNKRSIIFLYFRLIFNDAIRHVLITWYQSRLVP